MTSERKIAANQLNGRASSGPKTLRGKRRSSKNALRHGLSLPVAADPGLRDDIEALTREIAVGADDPRVLGMARPIAEAQLDLARIRRVRYELLRYADIAPSVGAASEAGAAASPASVAPLPANQTAAGATPDLIEQLVTLDRYERRTLSRRKTAIRRLMRARQPLISNKKE